MKLKRLTLLSFGLISCAEVPERPLPLSEQAPQVLYVVPGVTEKISTKPKWAVVFSKPVDEKTLTADSILLTRGTADPALKNRSELPLKFSVREKGVLAIISPLSPTEELSPQETYTLLVTPKVLSTDRIPLNQNPAGGVTSFTAVYKTGAKGIVQEFDEIFEPETRPAETPPPPAPPTKPAPPPPEAPKTKMPETTPVGKVVLNEIFLTPAVKEDDGVIFLELFGTPGLVIGGYRINMVKGSDGKIADTVVLPKEARLGPNGFFVIADATKGTLLTSKVPKADLVDNLRPAAGGGSVQILDATGKLVDVVGYGKDLKTTAENKLATFEAKPAAAVAKGHSLERKTPGLDSNDNSQDWVDRKIPTPGR